MTEITITESDPFRKHSHPIIFLFLILPFGIVTGYVTVTYAYLFAHAGVSTEAVAALVGSALLPQMFRFLWAPLVDSTLSLKKWYILGGIITAAGIFVSAIMPLKGSSLPVLTIIVIVANVGASFLSIATNGLAAYDTPERLKGRVSGYLNAGNLGGSGVGGGAGLWLAENLHQQWISPAVLALSCALCCLALYFVKEPELTVRVKNVVTTMVNVLKDVWVTLKARLGFLAFIICIIPLSTGAATNLWAAVADGWHASANTVELFTGTLGGIITALGCLVGGWICDRYHKQNTYIVFGVLQVLSALGMAYSPHTQLMYIFWVTFYSFTLGMAYAGFSAVVFEAIGKGAASTKYTLYSSISNFPLYYMTLLEGWAYAHKGPTGMLDAEAICGVFGIVVFLILAQVMNKSRQVAVAAEAVN